MNPISLVIISDIGKDKPKLHKVNNISTNSCNNGGHVHSNHNQDSKMTNNIFKIFSILTLLVVGSLSVEADYENLEFGLEYEPEPEPVSSEDGVTILDVATEEDSIDSSLVKNIEGSGSGDDAVIVESERANVASEEENYMMMDENVELLRFN